MTIELRSINSINNAIQAINAGDYNRTNQVNVRIQDDYSGLNGRIYNDQMTTMMQAIGKISWLTTLDISPVVRSVERCRDCNVPVAGVAAALEQAKSLESLIIWNVRLTGTSEEYLSLAKAFQGHTKLKIFCLNCGWKFDKIHQVAEESTLRNAVLAGLGSIPSLQKLQIQASTGLAMRDVSLHSMVSLAQSNYLKSLRIIPCALSDEALAMLAAGLNEGGCVQTLNKLSLCCTSLGVNGCDGLVKLLSNPRSKLSELHLIVTGVKSRVDVKELFRNLTNAFGNSTCTAIVFSVPYFHRASALDNIKAMLRRNYRIRSMVVEASLRPVENKEIEFLVKTNKLGRGSLLLHDKSAASRSSSACSWMTLVEATEMKLDNIYCLVHCHLDEFVRMGLLDSAQKMAPTVGDVKNLLHRTKRDFRRSFNLLEWNFKGLLQARNKAITDSGNALDESKLDGFRSKSEVFMEKIFEAHKEEVEKLLFKTEERIVAKLGNAGNSLEDESHAAKSDGRIEDGTLLSKTVDCTEESIKKAQANVASDDKDESATNTTNNNSDASWSKSKKKRMRRLRAKQKKQSAKKDGDDIAKKDAPLIEPEA